MTKDLFLYTGSTFDGRIVIEDIHGQPFYISEGDTITFFIETNGAFPVQVTLTSDDEVMGEYPFKLTPDQTASLEGIYDYCAYIDFADGDRYQIVPHTPLLAFKPYGVLNYSDNRNRIPAKVPRVMAESDYRPALNELEEFVSDTDSPNNTRAVHIRCIHGKTIVLIGDCLDTSAVTPEELVTEIHSQITDSGAETSYIAGFFHSSQLPLQNRHRFAVKEAFGESFLDVEQLLKTPVLSPSSNEIVSSTALELLRQTPSPEDILLIARYEYPACIMEDAAHFNEKGCTLAAKILLKEIFDYDI